MSGKLKHKTMVRPTSRCRLCFIVGVLCCGASLIASRLAVGGAASPRSLWFSAASPCPMVAAGGGGKAHSPLPKAASLGEEVFYFIFLDTNLALPFLGLLSSKSKLPWGASPWRPLPLQLGGTLPMIHRCYSNFRHVRHKWGMVR